MILLRNAIHLIKPETPELLQMVPHPVLVASWVGVFITSLNLLPAGQLDGGHVVYSLSPKLHKVCTNIVILLAIAAGAGLWIGWLLWAVLLMLPGMRHPQVKPTEEDLANPRIGLVCVCGLLFLLTIMLQPFHGASLIELFRKLHY
jgi:membrane-associated protease RseP (regulator of RpoE activity)